MNKKLFFLAIALFLSVVSSQSIAQTKYFSGNYTIGGNRPDYQTITRALMDLLDSKSEVIGRVTFNIRPGVYRENLVLKPFKGASAKNFVTFKSETGNRADVTILDDGDNTLYSNQVIRFEGCSYYTLQALTIENNNSVSGPNASNKFSSAIHFTYNRETRKPSEYNTVTNCIIKVDSTFTMFNGNTIGIIASDINNTSIGENCANYNNITNNVIYGGTFGLKILGKNAVTPAKGNKITGNTFYKCYSGIDLNYANSPMVSNNKIYCRVNPYEAQFGMRIRNSAGNFVYNNNLIKDFGTFGLFLYGVNGGASALVYNNVIMGNSKPGYSRGIHIEYSRNVQILHNSVFLNAPLVQGALTNGSAAMALQNSTALPSVRITIRNNIFASTGGAPAIVMDSIHLCLDSSNYNNYYKGTGSVLAYITKLDGPSTSQANLADIRAITGKDQYSKEVNPQFASPTDLRINNKALIRSAAVIRSITNDFQNDPRDPETPDIGADEVIRSPLDLEVFGLDRTFVPKEGQNILPVVIKNDGLVSLNGNTINLTYKIGTEPYRPVQSFQIQNLSKSYLKQTFSLSDNPWTIPAPGLYKLTIRVQTLPGKTVWNDADTWIENDSLVLDMCVGLNGVYTIGGPAGPKNYVNFQDAIAAFECGVGGPTVFNVYPGTYAPFTVPIIKGSTPVNTVTFKSNTGNAADVIIQNIASTQNNDNHFVIRVNGSDNLIIKNFTIRNGSTTTMASGIHVTDNSDNVRIEGCDISIPAALAANNHKYGIVASSSARIDSGVLVNNLTIKGCKIVNGLAGIYIFGRNINTRSGGTVIDSNIIDSVFLYGIASTFSNASKISRNKIHFKDSRLETSEGIRIIISKSNLEISGNYIYKQGFRALNLTSAEGITAMTISNNMFAGGYKTRGNGAGIYLNEVNKARFIHNSVIYDANSNSSTNTSSAFFIASASNISLFNNIFYNPAGGYAFYSSNTSSLRESDYNIYYTDADPANGLYAYWGDFRPNLSSLKASMIGFEENSLELNPMFVSNSNLHTSNLLLESKGLFIPDVTVDFDGQKRNPLNPDIGADEFIEHAKDLALVDVKPTVFSTDPNVITVQLMNFGSTSLNGSTIKLQYSTDGVNWVPSAGETVVIGSTPNTSLVDPYSTFNYSFTTLFNAAPNSTYQFRVRIDPTSRIVGDPVVKNDSLLISICSGLKAGTYTVGGVSPNFADLTSAVNALNCGITGPVTFKIRSGTYSERFTIRNPANTSEINKVVFVSETGNAQDVKIEKIGATTLETRNVVRLEGSKFIEFKNLTFENLSNSIEGAAAIQITKDAQNILIKDCIIRLNEASSRPDIYGIVTSGSSLNENGIGGSNVRIVGNKIYGGSIGVYFRGLNQYIRDANNVIDSNLITNPSGNGILSINSDLLSVDQNTILMRRSQISSIGVSISGNKSDTRITNNVISHSASFGLIINENQGLNGVVVGNNMVGGDFNLTANGIGISIVKSFPVHLYFNSVLYDGNSVFGTALRVDEESRKVRVLNNSFYNGGNGYSFIFDNPAAIDTCDNNNFGVKGSLVSKYGPTDYINLEEFKENSLTDVKSISVDPDYFSTTDLHLTNVFFDAGAIPIAGFEKDIDGELRNIEFPDIGASEFVIIGDVELVSIDSPEPPSSQAYPDKVPVTITVRNAGLSKVSGLNVSYFVNDTLISKEVIPVTAPYRPLLPDDVITYTFDSLFTPSRTGLYRLRVEIFLPDDLTPENNILESEFYSSISQIADGQMNAFVSPANSQVNGLTQVSVLIKNVGTVTIEDFSVNYVITGGQAGTIIRTEQFTDSIIAGGVASFVFNDSIDCDPIKVRLLKVYLSDVYGDFIYSNDTLNMIIFPSAGCFQSVENTSGELSMAEPWPNPSSSQINFDLNLMVNGDVKIEIVDVLGKVLKTTNHQNLSSGANHIEIDVNDVSPGIYYSRVSFKDAVLTKRILINR